MEAQQGPPRSKLRSVLAALPTTFVLVGLCALGVWGHRTGWKAPAFAQLFGVADKSTAEDWCEAHNVPDSECIACHPELAGESGADWCKEHGVPESKCTVCHPEILTTGVAGDWCREHGLPESGCTICHPEIARKGELAPDADAATVSADGAAAGGGAARIRDPKTCQTHALKVQFASTASVAKVGLRLGKVLERPMAEALTANAELDYDRSRFARLASKAAGTLLRVERELGAAVRAGDLLAVVESADVGRAKAELLRAQVAADVATRAAARLQVSSEAGFRTETERLAAEGEARAASARLFEARQALASFGFVLPAGALGEPELAALGFTEAELAREHPGAVSSNLLPLRSPLDGVVVKREAVVGQTVERDGTLFEVADTSRMWIELHVTPADARRIRLDAAVVFRPDDARDEVLTGRVQWIATAVDGVTRTALVRALAEDASGAMRARTFGRAKVVVRTSPTAIVVPTEAIQWEGCCHVVFVRLADTVFQTRKVQLGTRDAAYTEILGGVLPGEVVVTTGSHVLKSEILKSSLGAGCCADE